MKRKNLIRWKFRDAVFTVPHQQQETWEKGFHPDELYAKIGSSKENAIQASRRLK